MKDGIYMLEPKMSTQMKDPDVLAKRDAAIEWCRMASDHAAAYGAKTWTYSLIPHNVIALNMTVAGLVAMYRSNA